MKLKYTKILENLSINEWTDGKKLSDKNGVSFIFVAYVEPKRSKAQKKL